MKAVEVLQEKILVNEDGLLVLAKESFIKMASFRFNEATRVLYDAIVEYERIKAAIQVATIENNAALQAIQSKMAFNSHEVAFGLRGRFLFNGDDFDQRFLDIVAAYCFVRQTFRRQTAQNIVLFHCP